MESNDGIPCRIYVRRNSDGVVRQYEDHGMDWWDDSGVYQWTDGNFGCDCNRYLFFQRAADEDEDDDRSCSTGSYSVRITSADGTREFFSDF